MVAGAVSAGAVSGNNAAEERRIVTAAGAGVAGFDTPVGMPGPVIKVTTA